MIADLDRGLFVWIVEHRVGWLDPVFVAATVIGYGGWVWVALAPPLSLWARRPLLGSTVVVAATVWAADLIANLLKVAVGRPRPFETVPEADPLIHGTLAPSFPSGHAATSAAGALVLTLAVERRAWPLLTLLAATIAFSRVYVGVHYPADVLAGSALGALVALAVVRLLPPISAGLRRSRAAPRRG